MNYYNPYNPYYINQMQNYQQPQQVQQPVQQPIQPQQYQLTFRPLQGKQVDNIEVVKGTEIPLDGSISYFPLADGTAIITKQLQQDGTSRIVVFKPSIADEAKQANYITEDVFNKENSALKDEIKQLKKQLKKITTKGVDLDESDTND